VISEPETADMQQDTLLLSMLCSNSIVIGAGAGPWGGELDDEWSVGDDGMDVPLPLHAHTAFTPPTSADVAACGAGGGGGVGSRPGHVVPYTMLLDSWTTAPTSPGSFHSARPDWMGVSMGDVPPKSAGSSTTAAAAAITGTAVNLEGGDASTPRAVQLHSDPCCLQTWAAASQPASKLYGAAAGHPAFTHGSSGGVDALCCSIHSTCDSPLVGTLHSRSSQPLFSSLEHTSNNSCSLSSSQSLAAADGCGHSSSSCGLAQPAQPLPPQPSTPHTPAATAGGGVGVGGGGAVATTPTTTATATALAGVLGGPWPISGLAGSRVRTILVGGVKVAADIPDTPPPLAALANGGGATAGAGLGCGGGASTGSSSGKYEACRVLCLVMPVKLSCSEVHP
jgi:hypothetical protein